MQLMRLIIGQWGYFSVASAEGNRSERQEAYRKYQQGFLDICEFVSFLRSLLDWLTIP